MDMLNAVKSVLADVSSVSPSSEQIRIVRRLSDLWKYHSIFYRKLPGTQGLATVTIVFIVLSFFQNYGELFESRVLNSISIVPKLDALAALMIREPCISLAFLYFFCNSVVVARASAFSKTVASTDDLLYHWRPRKFH